MVLAGIFEGQFGGRQSKCNPKPPSDLIDKMSSLFRQANARTDARTCSGQPINFLYVILFLSPCRSSRPPPCREINTGRGTI